MKFNAGFLCLSTLLTVFSGGLLHGQTAAEMDGLLDSRAITWAQACRFVLPAAGVLAADTAAPAAFEAARQRGWLPKKAAADRPVTLGEFSFLVMQSFAVKKSVLYTLFPGPRYAYRQLAYPELLPGPHDPALKVSGERLVWILGRLFDHRGEGEGEPAAAPEGRVQMTIPDE